MEFFPFFVSTVCLYSDHMGRKSAMMIVNLPLLVAWFMMHNASSVWEVFVGVALLGLGAGLMESPIISYVGEIWLVCKIIIQNNRNNQFNQMSQYF